jgi:HEAT repeat protein
MVMKTRHGLLLAILLSANSLVTADIFTSPTARDVPKLIRSLEDDNVQLGASRALASLKTAAVPALVETLESESSETRNWAAYTLGQIGHDAAPSVPTLARVVTQYDDPYERQAAARALGQVATAESADKPVAVRALIDGLSDPDHRVRLWSATSLRRLGPHAHEATDKLISSFTDEPVREAAMAAVVAIGKTSVPELVKALNDDTRRLEAAWALRKLDPVAARKGGVDSPSERDIPALRLALENRSRNEKSRIEAAKQLGQTGVAAAPILIAAFSSSDEQVARAVARAFEDVGPSAIPQLTESLANESVVVRAKSADALGAIGPDAKPALSHLVTQLADTDRTVQHRVVMALGSIGETASEAVPALIEVMQNPRVLEPTRQLTLKILVRLASTARHDVIIAALKKSSKDKNYGVSSLASYSLRQLEEQTSTD